MRQMNANVSRDDLRSIAITSAIAAAGTALATSLVEVLLTRYVLKQEEAAVSSEPTFVVVPVVERKVPEFPVAGFGQAPTRDQLILQARRHPRCYSQLFSDCIDDDNRYRDNCRQFEHWHQLYDVDQDAWDREMDDLKFCSYGKRHVAMGALAGAAVGAALGAALYAAGSRR